MSASEKLKSLLAEREVIKLKLAEVKRLEERLSELNDGWNRLGEISIARFDARNESLPVYDTGHFGEKRFIFSVCEKWVSLVRRLEKEPIRYRRSDGGKEKTRGIYGNIDVEKALKIWNEHKSKGQQ